MENLWQFTSFYCDYHHDIMAFTSIFLGKLLYVYKSKLSEKGSIINQ